MSTVESQYDRFPSLPETHWYRDAVLHQSLLASLRLHAGATVLDVGCGAGALLQSIAESGHHVTGVDSSKVMARAAESRVRRLRNARVICGRYEEHVDTLGRFDRIVCKNVLHLIPDVHSFLQSAHANLSRSGFLLIVETVSPTLEANDFVRSLFGTVGLADLKSHFFVRDHFPEVLRRAGFAIEMTTLHSQTIFLKEWLHAKGVEHSGRLAALELVAQACPAVRTSMQIHRAEVDGSADWALRRLQFIAAIRTAGAGYSRCGDNSQPVSRASV